MSAQWQKIDLEVPSDLDKDQLAELGDLVIEHIVDRTQNGKDKNGKRFPRYSKSYMKSLDFQNAGKSSNVNLELSGDMLASLQILKISRGQIRIGFERGSDENARADGNIRGTYGQPIPNPSKARDFLGIEPAKLRQLIRFVKD